MINRPDDFGVRESSSSVSNLVKIGKKTVLLIFCVTGKSW